MYKLITLSLLSLLNFFPFFQKERTNEKQIQANADGKVPIDNRTTTFILLRHAEKDDTGKDPNLSVDGLSRAEALRHTLNNVRIDAIYSTGYKRTKQTVTPLATEKGIAITEYPADKAYRQLVDEIMEANHGKTVVIVGHSNTIPEILKVLSKMTFNVTIDESQFDNLFIVSCTDNADTVVLPLKYGKSTP